ncbi:MAG: peptidylprolyl isomerase [Prevotella sp.]|nr:peptidylprolyl isomerase [Prevotella sp.]
MKKIFSIFLFLAFALTMSAQEATNKELHEVLFETSKGNIRFVLFNDTPLHRDAMLKHVSEGFYDGTLFHRVVKNFMIQGGDPSSKNAQPGVMLGEGSDTTMQEIPAEIIYPKYMHKRGALAAARQGDEENPEYKSSTSQFYFVWGKRSTDSDMIELRYKIPDVIAKLSPDEWDRIETYYLRKPGTPWLDGTYTVFGEIVEGLEVVEAIQNIDTDKNSRPIEDVKIIKATIVK